MNSDLSLWRLFWSSNLILMVHLWSSNTALSLFWQIESSRRERSEDKATLSSSLPLPHSPFSISVFFLKITASHTCVLTPLRFPQSLWGRRLSGSCWIIFTLKSRLKSQITRGEEREQEGRLQLFFPPTHWVPNCTWACRAGCIQTYMWLRLCWGFPTHT